MALNEESTRVDWLAACEDAEAPGQDTLVIVCAIDADSVQQPATLYVPGYWAMAHDPGYSLLSERQRQEIYEERDRPALVVADIADVEFRRLLLRHEAEHLVQYHDNNAGASVGLSLVHALGTATGMLGGGYLYWAVPHERDANSAATAYGRELGIAATPEQVHGPHRSLFDAPWPYPDILCLECRQLALAVLLGEHFEQACNDDEIVVDDLLNEMLVGSGASWRAWVASAKFEDCLPSILQAAPSADELSSLSLKQKYAAFDVLRARLVDAETRVTRALAAGVSGVSAPA